MATASSGSSPSRIARALALNPSIVFAIERASISRLRPFFGELRITRGAVEQFHTELRFEIGERLADHRLRAPQFAAGRGKTAFVDGSDESPELIEGYAVEHDVSPQTMD